MKWYGTRVEWLAVSAALCAAMGTVQAQEAVPCRNEVGFASTPPDAIGPTTPPGAWAVVAANSASFSSRNFITNSDGTPGSCIVKVVTTPTLGKGKPQTADYFAPAGTPTNMTMDECSMYKYLSSVDSKMAQGKTSDALTIMNSMILKILTMQMAEDGLGRAAILGAAEAVQTCVAQQP